MLICDLLNKNNISLYNCDGLVVNSKEYSIFNDSTFRLSELKEIVDLIHDCGKMAILSIDRIIEEFELDEFKNYLGLVFDLDFDYYSFSDLAVINYVIDNQLCVNLIYDSKTMSTCYNDLVFYKDIFKNFNNNSKMYAIISNELTLVDVIENSSAKNGGFVVYGYHQIFYSRRLIFNSYAKYKKIMSDGEVVLNLNDKLLLAKEEFRNEMYPIYQSDFGTFVYNAKKFCAFKELDQLDELCFVKINSQFIEEVELLEVVNIYNQLLKNGYSEELESKLLAIDSNITKGFLYQDSVLLKAGEK